MEHRAQERDIPLQPLLYLLRFLNLWMEHHAQERDMPMQPLLYLLRFLALRQALVRCPALLRPAFPCTNPERRA
jgi:hypothetical protein